ncbi:tetratricopeptide repeat protein [Actinoplanes italicus]|uniref:Fibronectin type-III domain-containing protein n=1 Tax=Actinoplanes italicus TaxID=113567 RepID=A0A2T0JQ81_9ACTN|nr:tetratricopeptide repeat protein [Actinoplanes italicus]PRX09784.1 hypothetical protein CLV67_13562 [Actinoplanes italicus]
MAGVSKSPLTPALERARALIASGDLGPAQVLLERAVELGRENLGEDEPDVLTAQRELAGVFLLSDDPMAARRMLEDAYAAGQWKLGDSDPIMLHISHDLGVVAEELGNKHEARKAFGRVAANGPSVLGEGHQFIARARAYLGEDPSAVRPDAAPAEPVGAAPPTPVQAAKPAPPAPVQAVTPAPPAPVEPVQPVPVQRVQPAPIESAQAVSPAPVDRVPPVTHASQHAQGDADPRAAINRPTDVLPITHSATGAAQSAGLADQIQSSGTAQPPVQPQPAPPADHHQAGRSQAGDVTGQQGQATPPPGYGAAQAGHSNMPPGYTGHPPIQPNHTSAQAGYPPGQPEHPSGQTGYPAGQAGYGGQPGYPVSYTETPGYATGQAGHAAAPPAYPIGQPGHPGYSQPDGHGTTTPPSWQGSPSPAQQGTGWQGAVNPAQQGTGWHGAVNPAQQGTGWQGAANPAQQGTPHGSWQGAPAQQGTWQGAPIPAQQASPAPGWQGGAPGPAVQTYPYQADNGAPAHPYQQKGRGLAVGLTVAATLVALTAVGALVVVLVDREQSPSGPQATASTGPVLAGDPPSAVRLDDRGAVVELTWRDPTKGKVPFVVSMAREGQQLKPVSNVGLGKTKALVEGLNAKLEYCFAVVAVYGTDRFASSSQVCTERS